MRIEPIEEQGGPYRATLVQRIFKLVAVSDPSTRVAPFPHNPDLCCNRYKSYRHWCLPTLGQIEILQNTGYVSL